MRLRKNFGHGSLVVVAVLLVCGCSSVTDPDDCGANRSPQVLPLSSSNIDHYDVTPGSPHDLAEVSWAIDAVNVCTASHVGYDVRIMIDEDALTSSMGVAAPELWVLYGPLRLKDLELDESLSLGVWTFSAVGDFGIKDQWGEGPGTFHLGLSVRFISQGSETADMGVVDFMLRGSGHMKANYYDHT